MTKGLYFDYAATTPLDTDVAQVMAPYMGADFGNASSIHSYGQIAQGAVDEARTTIASVFKVKANEVIFTSGATEANNLAIQGVARQWGPGAHFVTTTIEHPSVLETFKALEAEGFKVTYVPVDSSGRVQVVDVIESVTPETVLVSVMYVNNETGVVQPIAAIAEALEQIRTKRADKPLYLHSDAVQAANFLPCSVQKLGVDMLSVSGHKVYGPKGVGALLKKEAVVLKPLMYGGHQEFELRAGTTPTALVVGFGAAMKAVAAHREERSAAVKKIRTYLLEKLDDPALAVLNAAPEDTAPHIINVSLTESKGERAVIALDLKNIAIATGSACSSGSVEPSTVLTAMQLDPVRVGHAIRISLSHMTTTDECDQLITALAAL